MSDLFDNPDNIRMLQNLLNPQEENGADRDSDPEEAAGPCNNLNPGNIGPAPPAPEEKPNQQQQEQPKGAIQKEPTKEKKKVDEKPKMLSMEQWQVMQDKEDSIVLDKRKMPEFNMIYRQAVGTEDVFLQMGNRNGGSACCEDLLLIIKMPEETASADKMDLSITDTEVDLSTPVYRLRMPLPHRIDMDRCYAKYEANEKRLCLKMRLLREFDYLNF